MVNVIYDGGRFTCASQVYAHDYGQTLRIFGLELPTVFEAHFQVRGCTETKLRTGVYEDGIATVPIPDVMLKQPGSFNLFIYARDTASGETLHHFSVTVKPRVTLPDVTTDPTEEDDEYFAAVIEAVTAWAEATAASAEEAKAAKEKLLASIAIGTVETLDPGADAMASITETEEGLALNLGIPKGEQGNKGEQGDPAEGGVGENVAGQIFTVDGNTVTAQEGAERFNHYVDNIVTGLWSHAEGAGTKAMGNYSHAEGTGTRANGIGNHVEGGGTVASNDYSHAEGSGTQATGSVSHSEGSGTKATGAQSHAEGSRTTAAGEIAHAEGFGTVAASDCQHVQGKWNLQDTNSKYADIVGNGTSGARSNAETTSWGGVKWLAEDVRCGGNNQDSALHSLSGKQDKLTFDSAPTENSTNPVTSGGVYAALSGAGDGKQDKLTFDTAPTENSANPVTSGGVYAALSGVGDGKQDKLTFDTAPTENSANPVTSGGVYAALSGVGDGKQDKLTFDSTPTENSANPVTSGGVYAALSGASDGKQDKLTFDSAPTENSTNPVTSGGVYAALSGVGDGKQDKLTFDSTPTENSTNPVTSGGVYAALSGVGDGKQDKLTFDSTPTENSANPVTSGGVYAALSGVGGVGESVSGKTFTVDGSEVTAKHGAERFNDYGLNISTGMCGHAEGYNTKALAEGAHSEGRVTTASGMGAHAEGMNTVASGNYGSHAEGYKTTASGMEGAHAEGYTTIAASRCQHVQGEYNVVDTANKYADIVGSGTAMQTANIETTSWGGIKWLKNDVRCGGSDQDDAAAISLVKLAARVAAIEAQLGGN